MAHTNRSSYQLSAFPFVIFAQLLAIGVTTLVLVLLLRFEGGFALKSDDKVKIFNVHPFLMAIGLIIIGGEAIMAYKAVPARRRTQKGIHLVLHLMSLVAGIVGIIVIFKAHRESTGTAHMQTLHSWLGISTIFLHGLQWVFAFFAYCFPGAEKSTRAKLLPWHSFAGIVIFLLALLSAETGLVRFNIIGQRLNTEAYIVNFIGLLILLYAISVSLTVILP